eukprot:gene25885-32391_t
MAPKKAKKTKAELEEEKLAREEEERKAKILEEKKLAEENEKRRLEELQIQAQQKAFREKELERLKDEHGRLLDELKRADSQRQSDERVKTLQQEFSAEEVGHQLSVGLWGSYSDIRPIRKIWQLERMGIKLEIAKQVLQQNEKYLYRLTRIPIVTYNLQKYGAQQSEQPVVALPTLARGVSGAAAAAVAPTATGDEPSPVHVPAAVAKISANYVVAFQLRARKWTLKDRSALSTTLRHSPYPSSVASKVILTVSDDVVIL